MSLVACECPPGPGLEPEPCSRARSQACMYLEQIRNRVAAGTPDVTKRDYLVDAATQIRLALERDVSEDYEAAFNYYQNGVDVLLRGVHVDPNKERCEAVKLKIAKYLRRAEEIFNCHLQRTLGSGASPDTGFSSLRLRPIRTLSSALEQLRGCRVVGIIEKNCGDPELTVSTLVEFTTSGDRRLDHVQLVQDPTTGGTFVVKGLPRCHMGSQERLTIIPHGVPYMTKLLRYFVSEDSIFLHLEHVQGGTLWSHLSQAHFQYSGLKPGSAQEKSKVQLNTHLCLMTPAKLPPGHSLGQDRFPVEPPWTSQSLPPAKEIPSLQLQKEADSEPSARTSLFCSSDLTEAPCGHLRSQIRRAGQSSNPAPNRRLHWVREGADRVLGAYGRGRGQNPPSANRASLGCGKAVWSQREEQVKRWAAEMLVALEALHEQGVLCRDLNPQNLLLDQAGHIRLTYFGQWSEVEPQCSQEAVDCLYSAPEVGGISELTEACDWWSYGSLLYELLTGTALSQSHPSGFQAHTQLQLPEWLGGPAASLLTELLQFDPQRRLGAGDGGTSQLKSHPFFSGVQWSRLMG